MPLNLNMIGILTSDLPRLKAFYHEVMGFPIKIEMENYVEFENENIRFALSTHKVMNEATSQEGYLKPTQGHSFELAFDVPTPPEVDTAYEDLIKKGATPIKPPADMPWGQRTAFFADPDGNIHEIFANL